MLDSKINKIIREVIDFPKKGISFKDITPLLMDKEISDKIISEFIKRVKHLKIDAIVGIESRGFLYGFLLANKLGVPFVPIRKSGKLPCKKLKYKYDLEYGSSEIEIHANDIKKDWNVLIHDDLLATGGTACAAAELIKMANANVVGFAFIVSLSYLNPYRRLKIYSNNIISLLDY
ncbi:MAG: adenine phosphoribosyltransferase [Flavobacteriales bacterium]|jgi:adenine phosphoribosyltransferase|nr:adenine phosphoribosyltransferase [Flavobacteriales bacterium]|tara:strand:- start:1405 stop:1932 length:528 start_codon:yes stop_codon:yes gene_type:complete